MKKRKILQSLTQFLDFLPEEDVFYFFGLLPRQSQLILRYYTDGGYNFSEISRRMGIKLWIVKRTLYREQYHIKQLYELEQKRNGIADWEDFADGGWRIQTRCLIENGQFTSTILKLVFVPDRPRTIQCGQAVG
jgi:hypothetical protein